MENEKKTTKSKKTGEEKQTSKIDGWFIFAIIFILLGIVAFFSLDEPMSKPYTPSSYTEEYSDVDLKHVGPFFYSEGWYPMTEE